MDTKHDILIASVILPARKQGAHLFQTFYSQQMKSKLALSVKSLQLCPPLCNPMGHSLPGSSAQPRDSAGKNAGVGCHALLQGIFLTQGSNLRLL